MSRGEFARKGLYAGTGAGIILFLLVGMFPGSLIGGAIGLLVSKLLFGAPVEPTLVPRIITVISMVAGIVATAAIFIVGTSVLGWSVGAAVDTVKASSEGVREMETAEERSKS